MNKTIYLTTTKKIIKHKFVMFMFFVIGIIAPLAMALDRKGPATTTIEGWDPFAVSALFGILVVTATNAVGNTLALGGRTDYMPLIVTRPMHRYQFVIAKWMALATVVGTVSVLQHVLLWATGAYTSWGLTNDMISMLLFERILSVFSVTAVLTLIYLLPTQGMILSGILAFELATGFSIFALNLTVPLKETSSDIFSLLVDILGISDWAKTTFLPAIFGGNASQSLTQYITVLDKVCGFLAPQFHLYDIFSVHPIRWAPLLEIITNILIALALANLIMNAREYHYDVD